MDISNSWGIQSTDSELIRDPSVTAMKRVAWIGGSKPGSFKLAGDMLARSFRRSSSTESGASGQSKRSKKRLSNVTPAHVRSFDDRGSLELARPGSS